MTSPSPASPSPRRTRPPAARGLAAEWPVVPAGHSAAARRSAAVSSDNCLMPAAARASATSARRQVSYGLACLRTNAQRRPVCRPSAVTTGMPPISRPANTSVSDGTSGASHGLSFVGLASAEPRSPATVLSVPGGRIDPVIRSRTGVYVVTSTYEWPRGALVVDELQVQVERPQRSEDVRPGRAASDRPTGGLGPSAREGAALPCLRWAIRVLVLPPGASNVCWSPLETLRQRQETCR